MFLIPKNIIFIFLLFFCKCLVVEAENIEVVINGIRSSKGQIIIGIYKDEKSFKEDKPLFRKKYTKTNIANGNMIVNMNIKPGDYGLALLDDENKDDEMNYSFIGIPKEGFGFSNYYHSGLIRPKFDVFKFSLKENQNQKVLIKIKYM